MLYVKILALVFGLGIAGIIGFTVTSGSSPEAVELDRNYNEMHRKDMERLKAMANTPARLSKSPAEWGE